MGLLLLLALVLSACSRVNVRKVDELNAQAYEYHYKNT